MTTNLLAATTLGMQTLLSAQLGTSDVAVYTVPASSSAKIATGTLCNTSGSAVTVYVGVVPSGGTAGTSHHVVHGFSLAANDTLSLAPYLANVMLTTGDAVSAYASTGSAVTMVLTGALVS